MPLFAGEDISQVAVLRKLTLSLAFRALEIDSYGSEGKEVGMCRGRS